MDGTVNWARREDGRPALAGGAAVVAAGAAAAGAAFSIVWLVDTGDFDLEGTDVGIDLGGAFETGMGAELATARGVEGVLGEALVLAGFAGLSVFLGDAAGLTLAFGAGLATFSATLGFAGLAALAAGFATGLAAALGACTGFTEAFATDLLAALATTGLPLAVAALLSFPDLAFTSGLLADICCAWSVGLALTPAPLTGCFGVTSPARECTGSALEKPISCKIETII